MDVRLWTTIPEQAPRRLLRFFLFLGSFMTDPKDLVLNVLLLTEEEEKKNENIEFNPTHKWRIILVMSWVNRPEDYSLIL